ncbi:MAG: hypothetical protein CSA42_08285 [Gammaproteobacteria bacterium]|nr:MAG: hypothetical protein CSA42_08285 [Gammaproteobacteria bacterium]
MSRLEKTIQKMRENPRDWKIETLESIARRMGVLIRKSGGSHVVFFHEQSELVITVPAKRPIKPIYIYQFLSLLDDIGV